MLLRAVALFHLVEYIRLGQTCPECAGSVTMLLTFRFTCRKADAGHQRMSLISKRRETRGKSRGFLVAALTRPRFGLRQGSDLPAV